MERSNRRYWVFGVAWSLATGCPATAQSESRPPSPTPAKAVAVQPTQASFEAAADYSRDFSGRAVLVMVDGQVVFERYDHGWSASRPHALASGTKSFTGVMAMHAVQDGLLSLDEKACDTITEWQSDPQKSQITARHLLTLSSGLDPSDATLGGKGGSRVLGDLAGLRAKRTGADKAEEPGDLFAAAVKVPMLTPAGEKFKYGPSHFYAFGELLERKLEKSNLPQKSVMAYMQARVFDPIGLSVPFFGKDQEGHPKLPGGCLLTAREWSKFGQFILQEGAWKQADGSMKQVLKSDLLAECFKPSAANKSYGLTWWLRNPGDPDPETTLVADTGGAGDDAKDGDARQTVRDRLRERFRERLQRPQGDSPQVPEGFTPPKVYMAAGLGKQRLYIIPGHKMVVVRFAEATVGGMRFDDREFLGTLLGVLPPSPEAAAPK